MTFKQLLVIAIVGVTPWSLTAEAQWITSGTDVYYKDGDVGVGTNSPDYTLDVESSSARAVDVKNSASSGTTYGVYSLCSSTSGRAVFGWNNASSGMTYGVYGRADSP